MGLLPRWKTSWLRNWRLLLFCGLAALAAFSAFAGFTPEQQTENHMDPLTPPLHAHLNDEDKLFLKTAYLNRTQKDGEYFDREVVRGALGWTQEKVDAVIDSMSYQPGRHYLTPTPSTNEVRLYRSGFALGATLATEEEAKKHIEFLSALKQATGGSKLRVVNIMQPGFLGWNVGEVIRVSRDLENQGKVRRIAEEMNGQIITVSITDAGLAELSTLEEPEGLWSRLSKHPLLMPLLVVAAIIAGIAAMLNDSKTIRDFFRSPAKFYQGDDAEARPATGPSTRGD